MSKALELAKACVPEAESELPLSQTGRAVLVGAAADLIGAEISRLTARIEELEKALTAADDMHAQVCEEVERLMDAKPGSAREAALELWSAIAGKYDEARWGKEFSEARSTLEAGSTK